MKVFIPAAFLSGLFDLSEEFLRADVEIKCENTTDESDLSVCVCVCVCVLYIQLNNIILQYYSAFGKFYLYLDIYMSGMIWKSFFWKEWLKSAWKEE